MSELEQSYPIEANLGMDCQYWCLGGLATGCCFPKVELKGRRSCEGIIDDVCLFIKDGRKPTSLTGEEITELKTHAPRFTDKSYLPPGGTT